MQGFSNPLSGDNLHNKFGPDRVVPVFHIEEIDILPEGSPSLKAIVSILVAGYRSDEIEVQEKYYNSLLIKHRDYIIKNHPQYANIFKGDDVFSPLTSLVLQVGLGNTQLLGTILATPCPFEQSNQLPLDHNFTSVVNQSTASHNTSNLNNSTDTYEFDRLLGPNLLELNLKDDLIDQDLSPVSEKKLSIVIKPGLTPQGIFTLSTISTFGGLWAGAYLFGNSPWLLATAAAAYITSNCILSRFTCKITIKELSKDIS